jgi:hypothetical protein
MIVELQGGANVAAIEVPEPGLVVLDGQSNQEQASEIVEYDRRGAVKDFPFILQLHVRTGRLSVWSLVDSHLSCP